MSLHRNSSLVSLLDVFSCGFGAAILLGFIFSVSRDDAEPPTYMEDFATIEVTASDPHALLQFVLIPPNGGPPLFIDPSDRAGHGREAVLKAKQVPVPITYFTYGGSPQAHGGLKLTNHETGTVSNAQSRRYLLYITSVMSGQWRLGVRYFNRSGDELDGANRHAALSQPVEIELDIDWLGGRLDNVRSCTTSELYLGETTLCTVNFNEEKQ
ncbi:hypothetical protein FIV42_10455 [Persicimonas caeni]|uniref:Uncharacterized protein n=1 Tax=Persicimonas caeni TaxID=2292766 RepID=A0A4Y6PS54_PERCE|nr:hypothetical protein [Persicimonas caeni]QDG51141.1 hypothetical protein FIV42_10455 [Persicimonas caeni]QED32362.1 hypothetical protein FRD00_10450 [Persicimonas caeni]